MEASHSTAFHTYFSIRVLFQNARALIVSATYLVTIGLAEGENSNATQQDQGKHNEKRGALDDDHTKKSGYTNGYSLGSGYSSGLLLPMGSGLGSRYASGLGYQTSGYGPTLGVGSGLGIASGLNSINSMGSAPVGLTTSTVTTSGPVLFSAPSTSVYGGSVGLLTQAYPYMTYSSSGYGTNSYPSAYSLYSSHDSYQKPHIITKEVPIHIPQPYPVTVTKNVPYPVPQPYAVPVPKPYPVHVPQPVAVPVEKPVPINIDRPVYYPYPQPVPYPVTKHVAYPVVKTYPVPYPVKTVVVPLKSNDYDHSYPQYAAAVPSYSALKYYS